MSSAWSSNALVSGVMVACQCTAHGLQYSHLGASPAEGHVHLACSSYIASSQLLAASATWGQVGHQVKACAGPGVTSTGGHTVSDAAACLQQSHAVGSSSLDCTGRICYRYMGPEDRQVNAHGKTTDSALGRAGISHAAQHRPRQRCRRAHAVLRGEALNSHSGRCRREPISMGVR